MSEHLRTARLALRPLRADDAPVLHHVFCDPIAMQFFGGVHKDIAESKAWVQRTIEEPPEKMREFAIVRDSVVIGKAGIWSKPELGFFLHRAHWHQGLMFEALQALLPHLFEAMSLSQITADVDPRNAASLGLLKRLGFTETGRAEKTIKINGVWCDSIYLACATRSD